MRRSRITITLQQQILSQIDQLIDGKNIRNRSHAIESILVQQLSSNINTAVILAGGKGTKLRPLTYEVPKSMLPIKGKPLLEYTIHNLKNNNIRNIIICIGYLGEQIKKYFSDGERFGVHITYSEEKEPLQTGGALAQIKANISQSPFLIIHGDTLTTLNFADLINFHNNNRLLVTVAVTTTEKPEQFGQLQLHGISLVNFYQHSKKSIVHTHLINCGMYVCNQEIFQFFPKKKAFLFEDIISELISKKRVAGFVFEEQWFDVGNLESNEKAIKEFQYKDQK